MRPERLTWLFAGLFLLCGLAMLAADAPAAARTRGGFTALALGGFALSLAADGWRRGQIRVQFTLLRRQATPRWFTGAVALIALSGAGTVGAGLYLLTTPS